MNVRPSPKSLYLGSFELAVMLSERYLKINSLESSLFDEMPKEKRRSLKKKIARLYFEVEEIGKDLDYEIEHVLREGYNAGQVDVNYVARFLGSYEFHLPKASRRPNLSQLDNRRTQITDRYRYGIYSME